MLLFLANASLSVVGQVVAARFLLTSVVTLAVAVVTAEVVVHVVAASLTVVVADPSTEFSVADRFCFQPFILIQ